MNCKICNSPSEKIFSKTILQKYPSNYYKCTACNFVQTDEPTWLNEAYSSAITDLDIGLIDRNNNLKKEVKNIIDTHFPESKIYLDFAGGYGVFVRLMRDIGYNFYRQDTYCENIFANHFDITDTDIKKFDIVTGFEVLEHLNEPIREIEEMLNYADTAIFSTELIPDTNDKIEHWWYITAETGQHIAFYSKEAMEIIAKRFNKNYYRRNGNIHIFTNKKLTNFKPKSSKSFLSKLFEKKVRRESLTPKDYQYIKDFLNKK
ncbi:MAG TPA: class I SAM-dependent methyltransferase [Flavobacterium sp.]|uniref:class I SAM-dependent methyltransferase n=1 Tax=Flavobacterium sp. TaxID=239 RepID=UPI002B822A5C|nr:class I SAM-dependent methyltransferase [Flavobacterium sp.]HSD15414.1 class I SAM-dependent methyltransferase [Flavobacterium sp.]